MLSHSFLSLQTVKGPNARVFEKIRTQRLQPIRMKDFNVPETLPCVSEHPINHRNNVYLMSRKGGFLNLKHEQLRQPVGGSRSILNCHARDSKKLENVWIKFSEVEDIAGRYVSKKRSEEQLPRFIKE